MTSDAPYTPGTASHQEYLGPVRGLLLSCRCPEHWRNALRQFLADYIMEDSMKDTINFLIATIGEARSLKLRYPGTLHFVPVNADSKPVVFPLERWRHLMVSLGFTLEEPDHNQDLRMCSVYVHGTVPLPLLTGILALLRCLIDIGVHIVRWLLTLAEDDAQRLLSAVRACEEGKTAHLAHLLQPMWDWHQPLLEALGYRRVVHRQHVHYVHVTLVPGVRLQCVHAVLLAMHGAVVDVVQETAV